MSWPTKPGDTFTAKTIGTYPELPESPFDTKADDPEWYCEHDFPEDGSHVMRYGGPKGEVVVTLKDGIFTHARPDGAVLRMSRWDASTVTWDEVYACACGGTHKVPSGPYEVPRCPQGLDAR